MYVSIFYPLTCSAVLPLRRRDLMIGFLSTFSCTAGGRSLMPQAGSARPRAEHARRHGDGWLLPVLVNCCTRLGINIVGRRPAAPCLAAHGSLSSFLKEVRFRRVNQAQVVYLARVQFGLRLQLRKKEAGLLFCTAVT